MPQFNPIENLTTNINTVRLTLSGETETGSAGEQPARDSRTQGEPQRWGCARKSMPRKAHFGHALENPKTVRYFRVVHS